MIRIIKDFDEHLVINLKLFKNNAQIQMNYLRLEVLILYFCRYDSSKNILLYYLIIRLSHIQLSLIISSPSFNASLFLFKFTFYFFIFQGILETPNGQKNIWKNWKVKRWEIWIELITCNKSPQKMKVITCSWEDKVR